MKYATKTEAVFPTTSASGLPPAGLSAPVVVRGVITIDRLLVELINEGIELELLLIGLNPEPAIEPVRTAPGLEDYGRVTMTSVARKARDILDGWIQSASSMCHNVFLPRPRYARGWLGSFQPGRKQSGLLYLSGDSMSVNARIAAAEICPTDESCKYLDPAWNSPTATTAAS
jgi:hypothetical protein